MLKIENVEVFGWDAAIRSMRKPMNSREKSDSKACHILNKITDENRKYRCAGCKNENMRGNGTCYIIGPNDLALMKKLVAAGTDHSKFMQMITVYLDITAPLYWWKEVDAYWRRRPDISKRTVMLNYEVLANMYKSRRNHKLDEWHTFCDWIERLPYSELITGKEN